MEITKEMVKEILAKAMRRCEAAVAVGGIPLEDVVDGKQEVPEGWVLDVCYFYIPPDVTLSDELH